MSLFGDWILSQELPQKSKAHESPGISISPLFIAHATNHLEKRLIYRASAPSPRVESRPYQGMGGQSGGVLGLLEAAFRAVLSPLADSACDRARGSWRRGGKGVERCTVPLLKADGFWIRSF